MAKNLSRNGLKIGQVAERDHRVSVLAEALRILLADTRVELYAYASEQHIPDDVVEAAFRAAVAGMLRPHGSALQ